jgi:hypothetical protein
LPVVGVVVVLAAVVVATVVVVEVVDGEPFATSSTTFDPGFAGRPAAGVCASTAPGGCVDATSCTVASSPRASSACIASFFESPTRFGIVMLGGPFETTSATAVPFGTVAPGFGACATTMPFGFAEAARVTLAPSFAARSWNFAAG